MEENLTLKRGWGRSFCGENWKLCGDDKWEDHHVYVPNGREPFHGYRTFDGIEFAVFRCLNDDYYAQPVETCRLPVPEDPLELASFRPGEKAPRKSKPARKSRPQAVPRETVEEAEPEEPASAAEPAAVLQAERLTAFGIEQMDD